MADCQPIRDRIADLLHERSDLQAELRGELTPREPRPSPSQKQAIVARIREVSAEITEQQRQLRDCEGLPPPLPTVTVPLADALTTVSAPGTPLGTVGLAVAPVFTFFTPEHRSVRLEEMQTTLPPFAVPGTPCTDTVTVSFRQAFGTYDPATGALSLPIEVTVSHSLSGGLFNLCATQTPGASAAALTLTTGSAPAAGGGTVSGAPLNPVDGRIVLVGSGTLTGGAAQLNGQSADLRMSGALPGV